jgi:hypothetical protein
MYSIVGGVNGGYVLIWKLETPPFTNKGPCHPDRSRTQGMALPKDFASRSKDEHCS